MPTTAACCDITNPSQAARKLAETFARGVTSHKTGRLAEARQIYQAIIATRPDHFDALHLLGVVEHQLGHHAEASQLIGRALTIRPDCAEAHFNRGNALHALHRHREALASYDQALALKPDYVKAYNNRSVCLVALHDLQGALASCEAALAIDPRNVEALVNRGNLLMQLGREEDALASYDTAWAIKPGDPDVLNNKGNVLTQLGRLTEAGDAYDEAIRRAPRSVSAHFQRVQLKHIAADDAQLPALEALGRDIKSLSTEDQVLLHFALGKVYADLGRHEQSFDHLLAGNALQRSRLSYAESATLARLRRTATTMTADLLRRKRGLGHPSDTPVFVVGMIRSGTTLIEQILASHPQIFGAGELRDFPELAAGQSGSDATHRANLPDFTASLTAHDLQRLGKDYVDRVRALAPPAKRIVDKMPSNFQLVGLIHVALPNARIIHVRRDAVDTCLSCFATKFTQGNPFTYDLAEMGRYYRAYRDLMEHWRSVLPEGVMLEVRYEDVVADLEGQARRVIDYCGLAWDDSCIAFHRSRRPVRTASAVQVRQPIYRTSVGRRRPDRNVIASLLTELHGASGTESVRRQRASVDAQGG